MAPVSTIVLPATALPRTRAVCSMVSVPWVMTIRLGPAARQRSRMKWRSASVICKLSIIMSDSIWTSRWQRPSRSISARCVFWKKSSPVSSLYSLSNVPPVTKIWMRWDMPRPEYSATTKSYDSGYWNGKRIRSVPHYEDRAGSHSFRTGVPRAKTLISVESGGHEHATGLLDHGRSHGLTLSAHRETGRWRHGRRLPGAGHAAHPGGRDQGPLRVARRE